MRDRNDLLVLMLSNFRWLEGRVVRRSYETDGPTTFRWITPPSVGRVRAVKSPNFTAAFFA
jgi:hypothetical protein